MERVAVQEAGCGVLRVLTHVPSEDTRHSCPFTSIVHLGGVQRVIAAMEEYRDNKSVQEAGHSVLRNLAHVSHDAKVALMAVECMHFDPRRSTLTELTKLHVRSSDLCVSRLFCVSRVV